MTDCLHKVLASTYDLQFVKFIPLSENPSDEEIKSFSERVNVLSFDINDLLQLQDEQFWNQAIHNRTLHRFLDTFLQFGSSCLTFNLDDFVTTSYTDLLTLVLKIFIRLCNFKSKAVSNPAGVLYDNYVVDIPKLLDICRIYHGLSRKSVVSILENVFTYEKRYYNDLDDTMKMMSNVLKSAEDVTACSSDQHSFLTDYFFDISHTLLAFLSILSELSPRRPIEICFSAGLLYNIAEFFEHCLVPLQHEIESNLHLSFREREKLLVRLSQAAAALIRALREGLIEPCLLRPLLLLDDGDVERRSPGCSSKTTVTGGNRTSRDFVEAMLRLLNYRQACLCLLLVYPLDDDLSLLQQVGDRNSGLDEAIVQYLLEAGRSLLAEAGVPDVTVAGEATVAATNCADEPLASASSSVTVQPGCSTSLPADVQAIKEVLPHFGVETIRRCLAAYDGDSSRVINAALEGTIPESILSAPADPSLPQVDERVCGDQRSRESGYRCSDLATAAATGLVRLSADNLWQGKRNDAFYCPELRQLPALGSREKRVTTRLAVSIWEEVEDQDRGNAVDEFANPNHVPTLADAYDDEYDDTYDINIGTVEKDDSDDSVVVKATIHGPAPQTHDQQYNSSISRRDLPTSTNQESCWPAKGADFKASPGVNCTNTAQHPSHQQPRLPPNRSNVLPIENPENVRQRQSQYRAHRRGRLPHQLVEGVPQSPAVDGEPVDPGDQVPRTGGAGAGHRNTFYRQFDRHNRRRLADKKRQLSAFN